ncbi:MAG TPA: hypothetical protein VGA46_03250 [Methyloceanibacter sp.]
MNRTTIRSTLSAIAALALVSAFEAAPASAQGGYWDHYPLESGQLFSNQAGGAAQPKGLAAKKHSQRSRSIFGSDVRKELSLTDDQ